MLVCHLPYTFYPDAVGGTEVYVAALARVLRERTIDSVIVAPGARTVSYYHSGLKVRRYAVSEQVTDLRELYGEGDPQAAQEFGAILDQETPDVVHLHAFTRGVSLRTVREAKRRGIPVVFTYHTPTVSCQRGTLMRWGREVCDGTLQVTRCTACTLQAHGVPRWAAETVAQTPTVVGDILWKFHGTGRIWTALRLRESMTLRHATVRKLLQEVDKIVVLCQWTKDLLMRNGVPDAKLTLVRHGLPETHDSGVVRMARAKDSTLRVVALGRLDPNKGFDTLIRAIRSLPNVDLALDIYGIAQGEEGERYKRQLRALADQDPRIRLLAPVPGAQVVSLLRHYELLAVPSRWLETGPLIVLEAFAAGVPVIGSRLGGIAELVADEVDGLLIEPDSVESWRGALGRLVNGNALLGRLAAGVRLPLSMDGVADAMTPLYNQILLRPPSGS